MTEPRIETMLGNLVLARGLVEAGCQVACSYPGTPSSEILPAVTRFARMEQANIYTEWSVNEKVAFDNALAASWTGKRAACIMKQVGLNVALDSLMSAAYIGNIGGMLIISADDPGPHSSQTEQDTRLLAHFAKVPVFDPSSPDEARDMIIEAYALSERHQIPVIVRPAIRVCHAVQSIELRPVPTEYPQARFVNESSRWAATPRYRRTLHDQLNRKIEAISHEFDALSRFNRVENPSTTGGGPIGVIAGGVPYANLAEWLAEQGLSDQVPVLRLGAPYPFPERLVVEFMAGFDRILVLEEPEPVIEMLIPDRGKVIGRMSGHVPNFGELTPERQAATVAPLLRQVGIEASSPSLEAAQQTIEALQLPERPPTLCPGCPHRAAFHAIRKVFKGRKSIYTSDIGCYTLGINMEAVDTCLDMGGGITLGSGFSQAFALDGKHQPVVGTLGDSTFYHSGTTGLINAVYNRSRMLLVILDNAITAMTGMQPTPGIGVTADGRHNTPLPLERVVHGCGVDWCKIVDPYDYEGFTAALREADDYCRNSDIGVAVIIARHPCVIHVPPPPIVHLEVDRDLCNGCFLCVTHFECPAIVPQNVDAASKKDRWVTIDRSLCVDCGTCVNSCPKGAFVAVEEA